MASLDSNLEDLLRITNWGSEHRAIRNLLRAALENSVQHGVEDFYLPEAAKISLKVLEREGFREVRIANSTFKVFPQRLLRDFRPGDIVSLSMEERPFPRGMGIGLPNTFRSFSELPLESRMGWRLLDGDRVEFYLRVPTRLMP